MMKRYVDPELNKVLAPVRRRLILKSTIRMAALGLIAALMQGLIWLIVSFFIPIFAIEIKMAVTGGLIFIIACLVGLMMKPSMAKIAREADRQGLEERVLTAWELSGRDDVFARLQRQDAIEKLHSFDPKSIDIRISKEKWIAMGSLVLAMVISFLLPNPQDHAIQQQLQMKNTIKEEIEKLEEVEKELADDVELTDEEREEIQKVLQELAQKLKEIRGYREAIKEVTKSEEKLVNMLRKAQESRMADLGEKLSRQEVTQSLGQMVREMDEQGIMEEMEKLKEMVQGEKIDREVMEALQKALEEVAEQLPDSNLKSSMMEAADAIAADLSTGSELSARALEALEGQLTQMVQNPVSVSGNIMYMLQNMKGKIAQAAGQDISNLAWAEAGQQNNRDGDSGKGNGNSSDAENNGGQGSSVTGNQESQSSSGSGSGGEGNSASGEGQGNSNGNGSGGGIGGTSTGDGQGSGIGSGHVQYEKIYDPQRLGDGGEISQVSGNPGNEGDSEQINAGQGIGSFDGFIPYNEVFGEYKSHAMQNLERMDVPPNMRELVKNYFSSLEE